MRLDKKNGLDIRYCYGIIINFICVIMVLQLSKKMFYSQKRYAAVSRSEIPQSVQMCQNGNNYWA